MDPENSQFALTRIFDSVFDGVQRELYPKQRIKWGVFNDGHAASSAELWKRYAYERDYVRREFMHNKDGRIDRHKIIAAIQCLILENQLLTFDGNDFSTDDIVRLNASFSFEFGFRYIVSWNKYYFPKYHFDNPDNPFDTDGFNALFLHTPEGQDLIREHKKLLAMETAYPPPFFWMSQFWFTVEQWGLTYMLSKNQYPLRKSL